MKIFFEDNEHTPSSQLLLQSVFGEYMIFTKGVGNYREILTNCVDNGEQWLIFVDYAPNNPNLSIEYDHIVSALKGKRGEQWYKNTYLIPVFCIEYFILCLLNEYWKNNELKEFLLNLRIPYDLDKKNFTHLKFNTIEQQCKSVLRYLTETSVNKDAPFSCLYNSDRGKVKKYTTCYYVKSCQDCDRRCLLFCEKEKMDKGNMFYAELPLIFSNSVLEESLERSVELVNWDTLRDNLNYAFDKAIQQCQQRGRAKQCKKPKLYIGSEYQ